ncbi:hypothetical protein FVE85_9819 [Porphyridium purpureum]|uniref:Uncharacterized protein n=1 Tax=Porphyridium purpureum TaxID=35688 RepID=A0A5J4YK92_PORPP|nr:hypothetical protein FVE85_9819 [Porphyridium purpureum]|eukprot:POR0589..scf289_17
MAFAVARNGKEESDERVRPKVLVNDLAYTSDTDDAHAGASSPPPSRDSARLENRDTGLDMFVLLPQHLSCVIVVRPHDILQCLCTSSSTRAYAEMFLTSATRAGVSRMVFCTRSNSPRARAAEHGETMLPPNTFAGRL